ncbi:MAG: prepilin-type N-terminal cleavage/methylation domain-containing protein [Lachnospiraceae bacterium]|nr:prepilin-type N-terminal cleavage/methylation domain-containing protein [Lachnospiraceae bacterium]
MNKNNKGFSLIELIVIIAIIGIVSTASIIGLNMINGRPADQCARSLRIALTNHRLSTMGKETAFMRIYMESDGSVWVYEKLDSTETRTKLCGKGVTVEVHKTDGGTENLTPGGSALQISFNRHNGSFDVGQNISYLRISKASHAYKLHFYNLTGKVDLERE